MKIFMRQSQVAISKNKTDQLFKILFVVLLVIPLTVELSFYGLILRERLYIGYWPYPNDKIPLSPDSPFAFLLGSVFFFGIAPAFISFLLSIIMSVPIIKYKVFSKTATISVLSILALEIVLAIFILGDAGGFLSWFAG